MQLSDERAAKILARSAYASGAPIDLKYRDETGGYRSVEDMPRVHTSKWWLWLEDNRENVFWARYFTPRLTESMTI